MPRTVRAFPLLVLSLLFVSLATAGAAPPQASGAGPYTIEQILAPAFPVELTSAKAAERIAWISYERGMRNVYTAAAPAFEPTQLTDVIADDGNDLTDIRLSDDGTVAVFVRGHTPNRDGWIANPTSEADGAERAIWGVRTSGGPAWRIAEGADPRLSPNGRWVLFTRDGQIHRAPVDPNLAAARGVGADTQLFTAFGGNSNPVWSPDGDRIAFVSQRGDHSLIGIYDVDRRQVSYLAPNVDYDASPAFSPDGDRVAFIRRPGQPFGRQVAGTGTGGGGRGGRGGGGSEPADGLRGAAFAGGYSLSFWVADVKTGVGHEFWHSMPGDDTYQPRNFMWANGHVVFQAEPGNWQHYYAVAVPDIELTAGPYGHEFSTSAPSGASTAEPMDLTPGDGIAEYVSLSPDGRDLFYATNAGDIDRRHLWRTTIGRTGPSGGVEAMQITSGGEIETMPAALPSGGVATLTAAYNRPFSVAVVEEGGTEARVIFPELTDDFPSQHHVVPENVMLTAADGVEFHNQLFLPADMQPGERRPAMLFTHGGPRRQMLLGYHYMHFYHLAYAVNQYFASQGYVTISVNYRSGIGYGAEFRNAPETGGRGNSEYQDVLAAGEFLRDHPNVDPDRIGLWGLSYGGILTAQGLARNSDIFAAGVDLAGVHLRGNSIDADNISYQSSAISAIDTWESPVLLLHGDDDRNVPFRQTTGLVQLLRAHDVYHELIVFPDDVHDSLLYERWLLAFNAADDFFHRFLIETESTH